jgi:hypothetical protein
LRSFQSSLFETRHDIRTDADWKNFQHRSGVNVSENGHFDTEMYDEARPWCMFNFMLIECMGRIAYRVAIGRIHVDAFLASVPEEKVIDLE